VPLETFEQLTNIIAGRQFGVQKTARMPSRKPMKTMHIPSRRPVKYGLKELYSVFHHAQKIEVLTASQIPQHLTNINDTSL
jgi:hypothetical protein